MLKQVVPGVLMAAQPKRRKEVDTSGTDVLKAFKAHVRVCEECRDAGGFDAPPPTLCERGSILVQVYRRLDAMPATPSRRCRAA